MAYKTQVPVHEENDFEHNSHKFLTERFQTRGGVSFASCTTDERDSLASEFPNVPRIVYDTDDNNYYAWLVNTSNWKTL